MSAEDSTASAMSAYVFPRMPATSFTATRRALMISPVWAARIPRIGRVTNPISADADSLGTSTAPALRVHDDVRAERQRRADRHPLEPCSDTEIHASCGAWKNPGTGIFARA